MPEKVLIIIVLILIFINSMLNPASNTDNKEETVIRIIAIFPISNQSDNKEYNYLTYTIRDALKAQLIPTNQFLFSDFSDVDQELKRINFNNKTIINEKTAYNICLKLKAHIAVLGMFEIIENKITIYLNALDISLNKIIASTSIKGDVGLDIFRIVDDVSRSMAEKMAKKITRFGPFSENFDAVAPGEIPIGWIKYKLNEKSAIGTVNMFTSQPVSKPNCLKIFDGSRTGGAGLNVYIQKKDYGQLTFSIKISPSDNQTKFGMVLKNSSSKDVINFLINASNAIQIKNPDETNTTLISRYHTETWYTCQINWDLTTGFYKIFINNINYGIYPLLKKDVVNRISIFAGSSSDSTYYNCTVYIDNLVYTTDTISINKP